MSFQEKIGKHIRDAAKETLPIAAGVAGIIKAK